MRTIRGDLLQLALDGAFDAIVHGCNCQCVMGKGIALSIKQRFPAAYVADLATAKGDRSKLGTITLAEIERGGRSFHVVNGYTQFHWQGQGAKADYQAIRNVMKAVRARFSGQRIGYPRIGAGLAGGDWTIIASIIDEELAGENHTLVEYAP
ncbi:phosphatase [Mesorhizobium sp. M2D.F.Ca.ET.185.01.1.1]|nr:MULTISPECIES: macro domain-containing protein [unclassified Mesorhizobium]RVD60709.1 phosphatase [Mesorhizobium sp. M2D.F.Ca.ET.140.01.1.1]TGP19557.1 phosphatase [Mesorhizobium sp. M2D.F.Ca.ET.233.01.1.1]TGP53872.1 phosphatase [bacterium M00.F.Ca.ET.230.01.1.1]TGP62958.1 phosphatase [Mesorhizobium sp. M2D.F.Ca.ET.226.01.1.1]TGP79802.1 phosphatase [Mesorhizobium sp. M2D.F.Ca.ET.224.01.1.1]TGP83272.1 phosphatase [bacterium M00.F.Ca.ET.227.01.1.1]TGP99227.1 phosphatase [bacterium M00.F.Ca.ET